MISTDPVIDPNKNWVFQFGNLVSSEISIQMQNRDGLICFSVPFENRRRIYIELLAVNEEGKIIEGKYSLGTSRLKESVFFNVLNEGKLLQGVPQGTLSRHSWTINRKD